MAKICKINRKMGFIVKNTTKCGPLDLLCPYRCRGCGELGEVLCECCKNYITSEKINHCLKCKKVINEKCQNCNLPFSATFVVGYRDELIGALAEEYKFFGVRKLGKILTEILDDYLPDFSGDVVIVPLPTIQKHVRERGVDHTYQIAKRLAKRRGWKTEKLLLRNKNTVQLGADMDKRRRQAKEAFLFHGEINENKTYVLFDDIWTTGASMMEAGRIFKKMGAKKIVAVVFATNRQGKRPEIRR